MFTWMSHKIRLFVKVGIAKLNIKFCKGQGYMYSNKIHLDINNNLTTY